MASNSNASSTVLEIPELLEAVLKPVGTIDLARARRVCHFWKNTVDRSILLQQALYLAPSPDFDNPSDDRCKYLPHVLFAWKSPKYSSSQWAFSGVNLVGLSDGTWRKMFVSQPPVKIMLLTYSGEEPVGSYASAMIIRDGAGITLGALADSLQLFLSRSVVGSGVLGDESVGYKPERRRMGEVVILLEE